MVEVKIFNFKEELEIPMQIGVINNEVEEGWSEIGCELPKGQGVSAATGAGFWSRS